MEYRNLGNSGLKVSVLGLGANNFGWWIDEQRSTAVINHALELGINFIDTADWYDNGRSEEYIGSTLKGRRKEVFIATKFSQPMGENPNDRGGSRWYIKRAVEASLNGLIPTILTYTRCIILTQRHPLKKRCALLTIL